MGTRAYSVWALEKLQDRKFVLKGHDVEPGVMGSGLVIAPGNPEEEANSKTPAGQRAGSRGGCRGGQEDDIKHILSPSIFIDAILKATKDERDTESTENAPKETELT